MAQNTKELDKAIAGMAELLEACTRAKGQHEEDLKAAKIAHEVAKEHMKAVQAEKEEALSRRNEMEKQMKEANEEFKDSIKSMPGAWDVIGKACADTIISTTRAVGSIIPSTTSMMSGKQDFNTRSSQASQVNEPTRHSNCPKTSEGALAVYKIVPEVYGQVETLVTLAHGGEVMKGDESAKDGVLRTMKALQSFKKNRLEEVKESKMKTKVMKLCKDAIDFSQTLSSKPQLQYSQEDIQEINLQADKLLEEAETLLAESHSALGNNALPNTSPNLAKQPMYNSDGRLVQQTFDSYRFRTETAKEMLRGSRRAYQASCDEIAKKTKEVTNLLAEMKPCTRAKGQHEEDLKAAKIAHEVAKEHMKAVQAEKEEALSRRNEMEKQMTEANEEFKESIKSMPGAWDVIGKAFADTIMYNSDGGLAQQAFDSCRFKTETAKGMLRDSRRAYEASCDEVAKKTKEVTNLLAEMKELDLKKIDMEKIR